MNAKDKKIIELKEKAERILEYTSSYSFSPKTNLIFNLPFIASTNLRTYSKGEIIMALAYILSKKNAYDEALSVLGIKDKPDFIFQNNSYEDIVSDMKSIYSHKENLEKIDKLKKTIQVLESSISEEMKQMKELEEISNFLNENE